MVRFSSREVIPGPFPGTSHDLAASFMHNRPNIKTMQTIGFSGKIVSALWSWFKGRFENKVDQGGRGALWW